MKETDRGVLLEEFPGGVSWRSFLEEAAG